MHGEPCGFRLCFGFLVILNTPDSMIPTTVRPVLTAFGRALRSQFTGKMLLLSFIPFLLSLVLWGGLMAWGLDPMREYIRHLFEANDAYHASSNMLASVGLSALKAVIVPVLAALLLLPLMIFSSLVFMGLAAMPAIVRHVSARQFPTLELKRGGSLLGSLKVNVGSFLLFVPLFLLTLPLYVFAPLAVLAQVVLWGWLTARVMCYDALADHASEDERQAIMRTHRRDLILVGMLSGAAGALPGIVWVGGSLISVVLAPFLILASVWIYLLIFIFTGLWFQYYCLQALADLRGAAADAVMPAP
jgi:hypothetical protein